uniref:Uncharacterized protein n=1 Tax=Romanomermis culicivorax TaxID=13658 RepID=A0A915K4X5_ROMCU
MKITYDLTRKFPAEPHFANQAFLGSLCSLIDQQSVLFDADSLMYLCGSLNFLTSKDANEIIHGHLVELGYIRSCERCLNIIAYQISIDREDAKYIEALMYLLSSITNLLRQNLALDQRESLLPHLILELGDQFRSNSQMIFQIFRLLSEFSICDDSSVSIIDHETQEKMIGFCINSLENQSENVTLPSSRSAKGLDIASNLVRVIANLSVDPLVGSALCTVENLLEFQICILERFPQNSNDFACIELTTNVLISLHNLTFHSDNYAVLEILAIRLAIAYMIEMSIGMIVCHKVDCSKVTKYRSSIC